MADLQVRSEVLNSLGSWLSSVSERLSGACNALRSLDASVLGAPPLIGAVHNFADRWHYGITQIGERADGVVRGLGRVGTGFDQCDAAVAAAGRRETSTECLGAAFRTWVGIRRRVTST